METFSPACFMFVASARSARSAPPRASKATGIWRVVDPPSGGSAVRPSKRPRVPATDLRPRVWTGVRHTRFPLQTKVWPVLISDPVFCLQLRVRMSCLLRSPPWPKIVVGSLAKLQTLPSYSSLRRKVTPALGGGRMIFGKAAR